MIPLDVHNDHNPYGICTWADASTCDDCSIAGRLVCRHTWSDLTAFASLFVPFGVTAVAGMVLAGFGWWLLGWAVYMALFFNVWETWALCRHCPYYARSGHTLHCLANHGCLKLWRYAPGPLTRSEQIQFLIGAALLVLYPFPFMLLDGQWLLSAIAALMGAAFFINLRVKYCPHCVNFSCPLNAVPTDVRDAYLRGNPVMLEAWLAAGVEVEKQRPSNS